MLNKMVYKSGPYEVWSKTIYLGRKRLRKFVVWSNYRNRLVPCGHNGQGFLFEDEAVKYADALHNDWLFETTRFTEQMRRECNVHD